MGRCGRKERYMNKIKVVSKHGVSQIIIKSLKGQRLNENEIYDINSGKVPGLLRMGVEQKGTAFKVTYDVTGFMSFREYLTIPLNKERFSSILQNILETLKAMESVYFGSQYLLFDFNQVMVNPATQRIHFVYVPVQAFDNAATLREFLLNIIQYGSFAPGENTEYVKDYITILNSGINFSLFELEEYINRLQGRRSSAQEIICPQCHTKAGKKTNYCTVCGARLLGNTNTAVKSVYDPIAGTAEDRALKSAAVNDSRLSSSQNTQGLSDGTVVLNVESGGTTVLGSEELFRPSRAFLIRVKNQQKMQVDRSVIRIGKDGQQSDFWVSDNGAVSRKHAELVSREQRYYIVDKGSTNKTYVDGRMILPEQEVEIFSGTRLRLANEEFDFLVET